MPKEDVKMNLKGSVAALAILAVLSTEVRADFIPYPNVGTLNPATYSFTTMGGDITAYFGGYAGAFYYETLGMIVNGVDQGVSIFPNHTTPAGASYDFGTFAAGESIVFYISVFDPDIGNLGNAYSDPSLNGPYDGLGAGAGIEHVYSTPYTATNPILAPNIPAGTYVGFEDLPLYQGPDYNDTDEQFVFTDVAVTGTPEPATLSLLGIGLAGLAGYKLRRRKLAKA
jgi:PEP-CTERM motif